MGNRDNDIQNLAGKILVATPSISNEYLSKSMIYVCSHDKYGAMGVVINKLIPNMSICSILKRLKIDSSGIENIDTHFGGMEEIDRCFIIHSVDYMSPESTLISENIAMTINVDVIQAITSRRGPQKKILCLGCCLWDQDQLENEVASSYWIPIEPDEALIFGDPRSDKWSKALIKIGTKTQLFSKISGNA